MSKEMQKAGTKKTASAPKSKKRLLLGVAFVVVGVGLFMFGARGLSTKREFIRTPKQLIEAQVVDEPQTLAKGLSGRDSLGINQGMLFIFDRETTHYFWMKDMKFSIDIIWLDASKKVVHMETRVSPDTYPTKFNNKTPALYVLEVPSGRAAELGIAEGVVLAWE